MSAYRAIARFLERLTIDLLGGAPATAEEARLTTRTIDTNGASK